MLAMPQLLNHWASRFGWMCAGNMALCVFFSLKNTPLGPLASVSHSQLNIIHRVAGYTTVLLLAIHALIYTIHFGRQGRLVQLLKKEDLEGIGAGVAMLVLVMGVFQHKHYELFYASHIIGFMAVVLLTALHRPNWAKKIPMVMLIIFSMWTVDRLIRLSRLLSNLVNNSATFYPLPYNGTRIVLKKPGMEDALPGSHCFLWIPRLGLFQGHPFTIVSNDSSGLELVMKSHKGFTKAVDSFATVNPGAALSASIDGPYGALPDMNNYDKLILIAGGSGAAFTFGVMNRLVMQREKLAIRSIEFVWAVRRIEQLSWFRRHLGNIVGSVFSISIKIYVTGEWSACDAVVQDTNSQASPCGAEMEVLLRDGTFHYETISEIDNVHVLTSDEPKCNPLFEKLDVDKTVCNGVGASGSHQRVLLLSCGPTSLMDAVQDSASKWQKKRNVRVDIHLLMPSSEFTTPTSLTPSKIRRESSPQTPESFATREKLVQPGVSVKENHVQPESHISQLDNDGRQPVPLSWKLASIVIVTAIGFGSGIVTDRIGGAGAMLYGNLIYSVGSILVARAAQTRSLMAGRVVRALGDVATQVAQYKVFSSWFAPGNGFASTLGFDLGIGKIEAFAGKSSANIITKRLGFAWVFWIAVFMNIFTNITRASSTSSPRLPIVAITVSMIQVLARNLLKDAQVRISQGIGTSVGFLGCHGLFAV
ncbi:ferric-chelate reductase [Fusarium sp. NRRL 52700]|nr:ferric-chelate reductase [Fusarium sp. NRRL 52700]